MNKVKIALLALFASFSTQVVKAEEVTEDFESVTIVDADGNAVSAYSYGKGLSNGWKIVGGQIYNGAGSADYGLWSTAYNGSKKSLEASYSSTNSAIVVIPAQLTGTFKFYARKTTSSSSTKGYVDLYDVEEDGTTYKKSSSSSFKYWTLTSTTWTEYTVDLGDEPRMIAICLSRAAIDDVVFNTYEAAAGPRLQVLQDGKAIKNGTDYNFGLVGEDATVDYTIKNAGTETMNATLACTGSYSVSDASVSLAAGEEKVVTITLSAAALGSQEGTLTISPEGLDAFTLNLAGIVRDPAKLYVDFSEAPTGWNIDTDNWTIADGCAKIGYYSSYYGNGRIESPLVRVAAGETIHLSYSKNTSSSYSSAYFYISTSADGITWTKQGDNRGTDAVYGEWKEATITDIPTSAKYIAISGQYIAIDDFYGLELSADPVMVVADETVTDNVIAHNFGKCKADVTKTYTINNIGVGALHVDFTNSNTTDFTISETSLDVPAGESATFDLTFNFSTSYGTKTSVVSLTPNAGDVVTINVTAAAQDPEEFTEDFEGGIPASWTNNGWAISNAPTYGNGTKMVYSGYSDNNTLITPRLQAKAGDIIEIQALQAWNDEPLKLEYSIDDAETWMLGFSEVPAANNTLHTLSFIAPEDGIYLLRFSGSYNYIDNICGFKLAQIPVMTVSTTDGASCEGDVFTDDFGRLSVDAIHIYTVANTGAGTLVVNIASDNADFTVSEATLEVGAGESKTFDLTFVHSSNYGAKAAVVTVTPVNAGLTPVTINASAVCADPDVFFVDFEDGIPAVMVNTGWTIQTKNDSKMAYSYTSDDYKLITPLLIANEGEEMTFDVFQQWNDEPLKLEYSLDYGYTWETAFEETPAENNTARQLTFTAPEAGKYLLRFSGSYNYIDNIYGFKLAEVCELALKAESEGTFYATFSSTEDVTFATDVTVSTVSVVDDAIVLTKVENGFVPANTGVLISSENTSANYTVMAATSQIPAENMLVAASVAMEGDNLFYKLAYDDYTAKTNLGFYWGAADGAAFSAKAGGAYLAVPNAVPVKSYMLNGMATAIDSVKAQDAKAVFNLQGQRIQQMQKGINIVNGRKVIK